MSAPSRWYCARCRERVQLAEAREHFKACTSAPLPEPGASDRTGRS